VRRFLGLRDLVHDAIDEITSLVEATHEDVARKPVVMLSRVEPLGHVARDIDSVRRAVARLAFDGVRGTNRTVQALCDRGIALASDALRAAGGVEVAGLRGEPAAQESHAMRAAPNGLETWLEMAESALNGMVGDFLEARGNPLATGMRLRCGGRPLVLARAELAQALPHATGKLILFVHGLASSDCVWTPGARASARASGKPDPASPVSFGDRVARALGYTPLYLRYNSGLRISKNGRALAQLLTELEAAYPVDIESIALVGHSMGGLVAQSAAFHAAELGEPWLARLDHVLGIGTPHFGAPLARAGHVVSSVAALFDTAGSQVSAKVLRARSAGIRDLSFGALFDGDGQEGEDEASLFAAEGHSRELRFVDGVAYGYVAARFRPSGSRAAEWIGDLLVHLPSASGQHSNPTRSIPFHMGHVVDGAHHVALTTHPDVYRQLERFLAECRPSRPGQAVVSRRPA
jgi:pimeloyl-ACP methyl ester carboxylesterase